jgi:hypothetical protein
MRTFLIACAGVLALSGTAFAQAGLTTGHLAAVDSNADGAVDAAEFDAFVAAAFALLDANGDGYVTVTEGTAHITPEQFAAANTNGDDGVSRDEFQVHTKADFTAADRNGDGILN